MLKKKKISRLLSLVVVIALVLASIPAKEVRADESSQDVFIITSFEQQDKQMPEKDAFVKGTKVADMGFPAEWNVKGYVQSDETKTLVEKTLTELVWRGKLKDDKQVTETFYTVESSEGEYVFELQLPDHMKAEEEVKLPGKTIKITGTTEETKEEKPANEPEKEEIKTPEPEKEEIKTPEPEKEEIKTPEPEKEEVKTPEPEKEEIKTPEPEKENTEEPEESAKEPQTVGIVPTKNNADPNSADPPKNDVTQKVKLVIKENLPERIVKGKTYKIDAQLENVDGKAGLPPIMYEIPTEYQNIVQIDQDGVLTVKEVGTFKVNISCENAEESPQSIERTAELPETDASIQSFTIGSWVGDIEHGAAGGSGHIVITVPYNTDVTNVAAKVTLNGKYATVTPASETAQNFNRTVCYTVTAEDGTQKVYDVDVEQVCTHDWIPATCIEPEVCKICKETKGAALGHKWSPADCTTPETCSICKQTKGEALGHQWNPADCTTPETCSRCKETRGSALGHSWGEWTVVKKPTTKEGGIEQRICSRCKLEENRMIPRLNIIGKPENNKVTGMKDKGIYRVDQLLTITAHGDGMDIRDPIANDVRYIPIGWKVTTYYKFTQSPYQVSFSVKSEGDYQLQVYFQKQIYDGKNWISQKETDVRKVNFTISNSKIVPVKTADETPYEIFVLMGAAALVIMAAGFGWMIRKQRRT